MLEQSSRLWRGPPRAPLRRTRGHARPARARRRSTFNHPLIFHPNLKSANILVLWYTGVHPEIERGEGRIVSWYRLGAGDDTRVVVVTKSDWKRTAIVTPDELERALRK